MKNNQHNPEQFDEIFSKRFSDFECQPEDALFQRIQQELAEQTFDQEIKDKLTDFTMTPSEKVWEKVQPALPLNLRLKVYLHHLHRVAAILLVGTFAFFLFQLQQDASTHMAEHSAPEAEETLPLAIEEAAGNFVFDIPETTPETAANPIAIKKRKVHKSKSKNKEADEILAFILADDDDFDLLSETEKMKAALQPVENLSLEYMTASALQPLPRLKRQRLTSHQDIEIKIDLNIPIKVVEPHEVEGLIKMYDAQRGTGN